MADFVPQHSIVRKIWGDSDLILLVFAGAAAEFALNRAVDWLFYTGRLPDDPVGRLFSTARYAQEIVFVDEAVAERTLDRITAAHGAVERRRGERIPDWAYRDVLYMLIDYSERAYRALRRPLTRAEQAELYGTFHRVGAGMKIPHLPANYDAWHADRLLHLERDLAYSEHTAMLYDRYREHLGPWRFELLVQVQAALAPERVRRLLQLQPEPLIRLALWSYGLCRLRSLRSLAHWLLLPAQHLDEVKRLEIVRSSAFRRASVA
ncbi:MAG: oxygenase MpaB family protein, partial [Burkholderiales bacterium]